MSGPPDTWAEPKVRWCIFISYVMLYHYQYHIIPTQNAAPTMLVWRGTRCAARTKSGAKARRSGRREMQRRRATSVLCWLRPSNVITVPAYRRYNPPLSHLATEQPQRHTHTPYETHDMLNQKEIRVVLRTFIGWLPAPCGGGRWQSGQLPQPGWSAGTRRPRRSCCTSCTSRSPPPDASSRAFRRTCK